MSEYIVEKKQTSGGWTWAEPKGKLIRCKDCKYLPGKDRAYADNDPIETYIHCGHLGENGYCSFAKRRDE